MSRTLTLSLLRGCSVSPISAPSPGRKFFLPERLPPSRSRTVTCTATNLGRTGLPGIPHSLVLLRLCLCRRSGWRESTAPSPRRVRLPGSRPDPDTPQQGQAGEVQDLDWQRRSVPGFRHFAGQGRTAYDPARPVPCLREKPVPPQNEPNRKPDPECWLFTGFLGLSLTPLFTPPATAAASAAPNAAGHTQSNGESPRAARAPSTRPRPRTYSPAARRGLPMWKIRRSPAMDSTPRPTRSAPPRPPAPPVSGCRLAVSTPHGSHRSPPGAV